MALADTVSIWNNLSGTNAAEIPDIPTADELSGMSFVDSSGNAPSGFNFGSLATGLKLGGGILGAFGAYEQGQEIAGADEYNAQLAINAGQIQLDQLNREETILGSEQRSGYLKSGVALSGSPLDVMLQSASQVELDKQITKYNIQSKVDMLNYEGEVAKNQAKFKMGESLLSAGLGIFL